MIYIASPYSHPEPEVMHERYLAVAKYTAFLFNSGFNCFSPIVYGHQLAQLHALPTDAAPWEEFNYHILHHCTMMQILQLPGHEDSLGVHGEAAYAADNNIPIWRLDPDNYRVVG